MRIAGIFACGAISTDCFAPAPIYFDLGNVLFWALLIIGYVVATPFLALSQAGRHGLFWGWSIGLGYIFLLFGMSFFTNLPNVAHYFAPWFFVIPTVAGAILGESHDHGRPSVDEQRNEEVVNYLNALDLDQLRSCPSCEGQIENTAITCPFCGADVA